MAMLDYSCWQHTRENGGVTDFGKCAIFIKI